MVATLRQAMPWWYLKVVNEYKVQYIPLKQLWVVEHDCQVYQVFQAIQVVPSDQVRHR